MKNIFKPLWMLAFLMVSYHLLAQKKGADKAHTASTLREVTYDFSNGSLNKPNSVDYGDIVTIKVENINSILYDVKVETSFTDYEIPPAFTNPTNYFIIPSTDANKNNASMKEDVPQKSTATATENDTKPKEEQVKKDIDKLKEDKKEDGKKNIRESIIFEKSEISPRYGNDYNKFSTVKEAFENRDILANKIKLYNEGFSIPIQSLIDACEQKLLTLEYLQDFNDLMFLLITAPEPKVYLQRKQRFDEFWKQYYPLKNITDFQGALFGFKGMINYDIPMLLLEIDKKLNNKPNEEFSMYLSDTKLKSDETTFRQAKENLTEIFVKKRDNYSDLIRNLNRLYEKFTYTEKVFTHISTPIQTKNKDYITVKIITKPKIQNLVFSRNMPIGDIDLLNLAEREFAFQIDIRKSLKINFSTGFIANITPRDMSYSMIDVPNSDNVKISSDVDKGFANSISYGGFVHVYARSWREITPAFTFGLGLNSDLSNINMLIGPSLIIGKGERFIITAGLNVNKVDRIKPKYDVRNENNEIVIPKSNAPKEITDLVNKKYMSGFGVALTFNLNPKPRQ